MGPCPVSFFLNSRGLRQGDPLLSYLSVLAMEVLSSLLERTRRVVTRWEFGEGNGGECVEVSHQNIGFLVKILKIIWFTYVGCL